MSPVPATRVLVIDDEPTIRELIAEALREVGYEVRAAGNGVEGLQILHGWRADAVVLDLMMPRLDGFGFVELLRLNPRLASMPIVMVTAAYGAREAAERAGVQAVLTKPFEVDVLVDTVGQLAGPASSPLAGARKRHHMRVVPRGRATPDFAAGDS